MDTGDTGAAGFRATGPGEYDIGQFGPPLAGDGTDEADGEFGPTDFGPANFTGYTEFVDPGDLTHQDPAGGFGWLGGPVGPAGLDDESAVAGSHRSTVDDFGDEASMVRPYAMTRGRTRSNHDLKLETLVSTTDVGQDEAMLSQVEHRAVGSLCRYPLSVAEVAAKLSIPLGVARVILSDMADLGLISIHRTFADDDVAAHLVFMERVLSGLRRL